MRRLPVTYVYMHIYGYSCSLFGIEFKNHLILCNLITVVMFVHVNTYFILLLVLFTHLSSILPPTNIFLSTFLFHTSLITLSRATIQRVPAINLDFPVSFAFSPNLLVIFFNSSLFVVTIARSSANAKHCCHLLYTSLFLWIVASLIDRSSTILKRTDDSRSPCVTPFTSNHF